MRREEGLQSKYLARSTHYLGMIFINWERIVYWNQNSKVDLFEETNVDYVVTYISQKFTREIRNRWQLLVSVGLTFQEHFLCIYSTLVFKKHFLTVL